MPNKFSYYSIPNKVLLFISGHFKVIVNTYTVLATEQMKIAMLCLIFLDLAIGQNLFLNLLWSLYTACCNEQLLRFDATYKDQPTIL